MTPEQSPPMCPNCQTPMSLRPAGISKKTDKPYPAFWACPNNRSCGSKPITYVDPKGMQKAVVGIGKKETLDANPLLLICDELRTLNDRLDRLANYLIEKLGK